MLLWRSTGGHGSPRSNAEGESTRRQGYASTTAHKIGFDVVSAFRLQTRAAPTQTARRVSPYSPVGGDAELN